MAQFVVGRRNLVRTLSGAGAVLAIAALGMAQAPPASPASLESNASGNADSAFEQMRAEFGTGLRAVWDFDSGFPTFIYGVPMDFGSNPQNDAEFDSAARRVIDTFPGLFGYDSSVLVTKEVHHHLLAKIGSTDKTSVEFAQSVGGLDVTGGTASVLFNFDGRVVGIENMGLPGVANVDVVPVISETQATRIATLAFGKPNPKLLKIEIAITWNAAHSASILAWIVDLRAGHEANGLPQQERFTVDAHTGAVVGRENTIFTFTDYIGNTEQSASPGTKPYEGSNPNQFFVSQRTRHSIPGLTAANTDLAGNWTISYSGNANNTVTVNFNSSSIYAWVSDQQGADFSRSKACTPGVLLSLKLNKKGGENATAEINAQRHGVNFREWVVALDSTDTHMDFRQHLNVNIRSTCNAYYDGSSTNYYKSGGGCVNTAYSTVVDHETGHWANDKYGEGNGGDGYGEGAADTWAEYIMDTNIVGQDFCGTGCNVRDGNNTTQYCGSCGAGCYGEVHKDGEVLMGAMWKMRVNIDATLGDASGDAVADNLWLKLKQIYNEKKICDTIETKILTIDDNDGNIANGTPHGTDIDNGFKAQGFPGVY